MPALHTNRVPRVRIFGPGRLATTLLVLLAITTTLHAQAPADGPIRAMMQKSVDDWNRGDLDAFATSYKHSPDILFIGRKISRGYDQMLATYKAAYGTPEKRALLHPPGDPAARRPLRHHHRQLPPRAHRSRRRQRRRLLPPRRRKHAAGLEDRPRRHDRYHRQTRKVTHTSITSSQVV